MKALEMVGFVCRVVKNAVCAVPKKVYTIAVGGLVASGLVSKTFAAAPLTFTMPTTIDWAATVTAAVLYIGGALVAIMGAKVAFSVLKRLLRKLGGVA